MQYEVENRRSGEVLFTAEIEADEGTTTSIKLGLAVKWAMKSDAYLRDADLRGAYLRGADLRGAYLRGADLRGADLRGADLGDADLRGADLRGADLRGAYLRGADMGGAYLRGAYLRGADLRGADLRGADLGDAVGLNHYLCTPSLGRLHQPGKQRAYKLVNSAGFGIYRGGINYEIGSAVSVGDANTDPNVHCGAGINVAEIDWICREWQEGYRVLLVEFKASDIACIPTATDGKFRLHRCKVVEEVDLASIGLVESDANSKERA